MNSVVVFDLGGVLARICHTWQEAIATANVSATLPAHPPIGLTQLPEFDLYQSNDISLEAYLDSISAFTGCDRARALDVHNAIIIELYAGVREIIDQLHSQGTETGCLSNTNEPHWQELAFSDRFHAIRDTKYKMASHRVGLNKPDPRIYARYCSEFDLQASQIVYFDDNEANVLSAVDFGFRAHRIDPSHETAPQIRGILELERVF